MAEPFTPSFTNWIFLCWVFGWDWLPLLFSSTHLANSFRTWSWRHLYLPWLKATLHPVSMWFNVACFPHRTHTSSVPNHTFLFAGVGNRSCTALTRNLRPAAEVLRMSLWLSCLSGTCYLVLAPCLLSCTILVLLLSSSASLIVLVIMVLFSFFELEL